MSTFQTKNWLGTLKLRRGSSLLRAGQAARKARAHTVLAADFLEDRCLLSTWTVNNTLDDGSTGSLRWAITQADSMGGTETIDFDPIVFATQETITLNSALPELSDTTGTMTIDGPALGVTVARNSAAVTPFIRIFKVDTGVTAAMTNLTITGGDVVGDFGGGIYNNGTLALTECTVDGNSAPNGGGGIFNQGTVTVTASTISGNSSRFGGGIFSIGTVTATNSTISGNSAINNGGGVYTRQRADDV